MKRYLRDWWQRLPQNVRKGLVLFAGALCILGSLFFGWLPGPGGIPLFLLGIAILSTEFKWAERFKHFVLGYVKVMGNYLKKHRVLAVVAAIGGVLVSAGVTIWTIHVYNQSH